MSIKPPPLKAKPADIADWVEFRVLTAPTDEFRILSLKRYWDTHRENEDADPEGVLEREASTDDDGVSGVDEDAFYDAIADELNDRARALKGSYPFEFVDAKFCRKQNSDLSDGGYAYLFCLLIANCKEGEILDGTWKPQIDNKVRDLFQVCATLAAAGHVAGCSISFGWPRPNNNPKFLRKLQEVYELFGEGTVVTSPRPGASVYAKDEEIDVIAWRPRASGAPGTEYLLGQAASGDNWEAKSIKGSIKYFHRTWFTLAPASASQAATAIFIPHALPPHAEGDRRERMDLLVEKFGRIFDRLELPHELQAGINLAANSSSNGFTIERHDEFQKVISWVNTQVQSLKSHGEGPL